MSAREFIMLDYKKTNDEGIKGLFNGFLVITRFRCR